VISIIGTVAVTAAWLGSAALAVLGLLAGFRRSPQLLRGARYAAGFVLASMVTAVGAMEYALLTHDFSVEYVANVGSRETPAYYSAISLWSSLEGSILFWGFILAAYTGIVVWVQRRSTSRLLPFALGTLGLVGIFFYGLVATAANPFGVVSPVPANGPGPNPLLQNHPLMGLHPPLLYLGYVGMSVPFAFAIGALFSGKVDDEWIRTTRRWMVTPWAFLSLGIVAGAWWSYEVLGWGGYWAWDPVENASFLPWLTATAFLHSVMVQERSGMLKTWNLTLVIGTFLLTLFGTFLTRSGVLDSVHAFTEGFIGPLFLGFIAVVTLASLTLIAWRSDRLHSPGRLDGVVSRESSFILNNLIFAAFTFTVLLGTTFPLVVEAINGDRISVGPPYFNMVSVPLGLLLLFLMGVGPALPWRRTSSEKLRRTFVRPVVAGLLVVGAAVALGVREPYPIITFGFAGFVMATIAEEFAKGVSARRRIGGVGPLRALGQLLVRNNRRYGGYIVHVGVVVIVVALSISGTWRFEREATLRRGQVMLIGDYSVRFDSVNAVREPHRDVVAASFTAMRGDRDLGTIVPRTNFYRQARTPEPIATPAVRSFIDEDLYMTLMSFDPGGEHATVRVIVNPGVPWLWIGGMIIGLGAILAVAPQRRRPQTVRMVGARPEAS
jgi:cytochrome c-type biogenesis protein CcmF